MMRSLTAIKTFMGVKTCQGTSSLVPKSHGNEWPLAPVYVAAMLFLVLPLLSAQPTNWNDAARELARHTAEKMGTPSNVSLTVKNSSLLSAADVVEIRHDVESQLSSAGMRIVKPDQSVADLQLTLSQNVQGWLWVAELRRGNTSDAILIPVLTHQAPPLPGVSSAMTLHKTFLWAQPDATPVLDVAVLGGGSNPNALLVLDASMVALYRMQSSHWELEQAQPIARSRPWPRDLRGRLMIGHDRKFEAYLPGMKCTGSADSGLTMECHNADDPWPLGASDDSPRAFFGGRNFFTGAFAGGVGTGAAGPYPFFSAAGAHPDFKEALFLAQTNGVLRLNGSPQEGVSGWGSDLAGIKSSCGRNWQVLFTGTGDYTQPDSVQAGEAEGSVISSVSAPVDFPGPVTALWPASDSNTAIAVCKNLSTGRYEAFSLSIACR
jgi:hypothetical protein